VLQGLPTLSFFGRSGPDPGNLQVGERYRETTLGVLKVAFLSALVLELVATLSTAVVAVEIGLRVLYGRLAFENALFVLLLAPEFYLPLRLLGSRFHAGMSGIASARSLFSILETPAPEIPSSPGTISSAVLQPGEPVSIKFEEVSYAFPGERTALDRVTFQIPARQITALVGASGAGKSTLVDLLLGFLQPKQGQIWVNGAPLEDIAPGDWRHWIAWVPQNPYLFDTTVAENIRLGRPQASSAEVRLAAMHAYAHEFIQLLPHGYDTHLGEQAARLSIGQAQRLALARAFLKNAPVLILDEPTAHLDPAHAALLDRAVRCLAQGRTVLVIAHRLPTIASADHLVLLDHGRVVETGSPAELLNRDGELRSLPASLPDVLASRLS
jgi:ATP-binding cassette subfamily C protein CydD